MEENIRLLTEMRDELLKKVAALDSAISILRDIQNDINPSSSVSTEAEKPKPRRRKKQTVDVDLSSIPDYNPNGGGIRLDK